jgi:hypothetical protein
VDLDDVAADLIAVLANIAEERNSLGKTLCLLVQDPREETCRLGRLRKAVQPEALSGFFGVIDEVVELDGKLADVFAVEWCDERAVERAEDAVGDLVAAMLEIAQKPDVSLPIRPVGDHPGENLGHFGGIDPGVLELVEELLVTGQKSG